MAGGWRHTRRLMPAATVVPLHPGTPALFNPQARVCAECGVRRFSLFGVLDAAALDQIHIHIADIKLAPGQTLFSAQDPGQAGFTV